jgi:hypothetical protein
MRNLRQQIPTEEKIAAVLLVLYTLGQLAVGLWQPTMLGPLFRRPEISPTYARFAIAIPSLLTIGLVWLAVRRYVLIWCYWELAFLIGLIQGITRHHTGNATIHPIGLLVLAFNVAMICLVTSTLYKAWLRSRQTS